MGDEWGVEGHAVSIHMSPASASCNRGQVRAGQVSGWRSPGPGWLWEEALSASPKRWEGPARWIINWRGALGGVGLSPLVPNPIRPGCPPGFVPLSPWLGPTFL